MRFQARGAKRVRGFAVLGRYRVVVIIAALALGLDAAQAQQSSDLTPDILQQLHQMKQGAASGAGQGVMPQRTILQPSAPANPLLPTSRLEQILSTRAGVRLKQFGYDQLGVGQAVTMPQMGAVQDNYILGPGDEIVVTLRGQENSEYRTSVDRDGMVTLPRLSPISAGGRTLGDFRRDLIAAIHRAYVSTEGFVSIGQLRQISVLVSGEVNNPGVRILTGLSTPVDAILVSGGVKKTGSLRNVYMLRKGNRTSVDLYSVLTGRARASSVSLSDGDRIVVPPLGPTAAVVGWIRRPGIYEIANGRSSISVRDLLSLAGGLEVRGRYRLSALRVAPDGRNQMVALAGQAGTMSDSDILFVLPSAEQTTSRATLAGGMPLAGQYSVKNTKLSELLNSPGALGDDPYTLFGVISRRDPVTLLRTLVAFTPVAVLKGTENMDIQSDDIVRVISAAEARLLFATVQQYNKQRRAEEEALRNPLGEGTTVSPSPANIGSAVQSVATSAASEGQSALNTLAFANRTAPNSPVLQNYGQPTNQSNPQAGQLPQTGPMGAQYPEQPMSPNLQEGLAPLGQTPTNQEVMDIFQLSGQLRVDPLVLVNFLRDHLVNVDGAVQGAGLYLVGPDADLRSLLAAAGGVTRWADKSAIEVISTQVDSVTGTSRTERKILSLADAAGAGYIVSPYDEVRINQVFTDVGIGSVTVQGQVRNVGTYQIIRGEHLSDLLLRAGGLTESAYPYGTIFLRRSTAEREQASFKREAAEIENQLLLAISRHDTNAKLSPDAFTALQGYVNQLKNQKALGRIAIMADPAVLAANPAMDPLLEPGDVVYVPPRPYSVSVFGEVLQPGSVPFVPSMSYLEYIGKAGGYSQFADKSRVILVLPDGSARPLEASWFSFGEGEIPPGSTIYVSRDISGIDLHQIIVDTTQIISQLATTAAALAVLSKY